MAQYVFRITYASSQVWKTLQRLHSQHEAREKILALYLYLRKKAKKPSFVRAKVEGEFRTAPRLRVGDGRPGGMQVQDRDELIAKAHEVAEGPHDDAEFLARLAVRLGDAQLAGHGIAFVDDVLLERKLEFVAVDFCAPVFRLVLSAVLPDATCSKECWRPNIAAHAFAPAASQPRRGRYPAAAG